MNVDGVGWMQRIAWYAFLSLMGLATSKFLSDRYDDMLIMKLGLFGTAVFFLPLTLRATVECLVNPWRSKEEESEDD